MSATLTLVHWICFIIVLCGQTSENTYLSDWFDCCGKHTSVLSDIVIFSCFLQSFNDNVYIMPCWALSLMLVYPANCQSEVLFFCKHDCWIKWWHLNQGGKKKGFIHFLYMCSVHVGDVYPVLSYCNHRKDNWPNKLQRCPYCTCNLHLHVHVFQPWKPKVLF